MSVTDVQLQLRDLSGRLFNDAYPHGDANDYLLLEPEIHALLKQHPGVTTDLTIAYGDDVESNIALAAVLSDFTSLYAESPTQLGIKPSGLEHWPKELLAEIGTSRDLHSPVVVYWYGFLDDELIDDLQPLCESGRLMLRPKPRLKFPAGSDQQVTVNIEPNLPEGFWLPWRATEPQESVPLQLAQSKAVDTRVASEIILPYISGMRLPEIAKILDDENDLLAQFRSGLRTLVDETQKNGATADVVNDVVRPATDQIHRKFKSITQMHSLRVAGATLSTCAMSLLALTDAGMAASIAKVAGPAGVGLMGKEIADFIKAKAELREMPYYLLWRIGDTKR